MRKKTIAAIFSVYFVICAAYGISRSTVQSTDNQSIQITEQEAVSQTTKTTAESKQAADSGSAQTTTKSTAKTQSEQSVSDNDEDDSQPDAVYTSPSETTITQQTQPDVPSLDEYLKKLRCSGCRHNCSLANPRCMNGRRKASSAESEYYSIYG